MDRVLVSLPCYNGDVKAPWLMSWTRLQRWAFTHDVELSLQTITNESLLPRARNFGVIHLLDHQHYFSHILFADADMGFSVRNFVRLLSADRDMVGCPGPTKRYHWELVPDAVLRGFDPQVYCLRYAINFTNPNKIRIEHGYAECLDMGCCFFLVKTSALVQMWQHHPELRCENMGFFNGENLQSPHQIALFDSCVIDGNYHECDHAFMARWRQMGGSIYADMTSNLSHSGNCEYRGDMSLRYGKRPSPDSSFDAFITRRAS